MSGPASQYVLGVDVGTQSLRVGLFDLDGHPVVFADEDLTTSYPRPGWAEQSPAEWWEKLVRATRRALAESGVRRDDVVGLSVDGSCSNAPLRADGTPLGPAFLWMDLRAASEAARITATGDPALASAGGEEPAEWPLAKALWLKAHDPARLDRADYLMESTNWLIYRLTGEATLPLNSAACKWHYSAKAGGLPWGLARRLGAEDVLAKLPGRVLHLGERAGGLTTAAADALGLRPGTAVGQGGIDAYTGMIGLDVLEPGRLALVMGSSTCQLGLAEAAVVNPEVWGPFPEAVVPGLQAVEGGQASTGSVVRWLVERFGGPEASRAAAIGEDVYSHVDALAAEVPPGAEGLVVLDYWQGNRMPLRDPLARGAVWGLTLRHGFGHLLRGIYEATALGNRQILQSLRKSGVDVSRIYACGGGTKSRLWLRIHADVSQVPIYLTEVPDAVALGTAICGAVAAGAYSSLSEAAGAMVRVATAVEPAPATRDVYDALEDRYRRTYLALRDLMHEAARD